jgi:hypothetical protein
MYAGRDGNVYRNTGDGWQRWDGGWQDVARPESGDLLQRGEGLSPEARERLQERGGGEVGRGLAAAGAAGAAGAALGQRLSGETPRRENVNRDRVQDRVAQGSGNRQNLSPEQRPRSAANERPATRQKAQAPARDRPAAKQRPAAAQRPAPSRPAASQQLPSNLTRDVQARNLGNQRQMASRQAARPSPAQFSRPSRSFSPQRSYVPRGGGFGGGGRSFGGGGFGGRGGGGGRRR